MGQTRTIRACPLHVCFIPKLGRSGAPANCPRRPEADARWGPETEAGPVTVGYRAFGYTVAVIGHTRLSCEFAAAAIASKARI